MQIQETVQKLKLLEERATQGKWEYDFINNAVYGNDDLLICSDIDNSIEMFFNPDFALISEMRNALPQLLAVLEKALVNNENGVIDT